MTWKAPGALFEQVVPASALSPSEVEESETIGGNGLRVYWVDQARHASRVGHIDWQNYDRMTLEANLAWGLTKDPFEGTEITTVIDDGDDNNDGHRVRGRGGRDRDEDENDHDRGRGNDGRDGHDGGRGRGRDDNGHGRGRGNSRGRGRGHQSQNDDDRRVITTVSEGGVASDYFGLRAVGKGLAKRAPLCHDGRPELPEQALQGRTWFCETKRSSCS